MARPSGYFVSMLNNILLPVDKSDAFEAAFSTAVTLLVGAPVSAQIDALYVLSVSRRKGRFLEDLSGMMGFEPVLVPEQVEAWYRGQGEKMLGSVVNRIQETGHRAKAVLDQGAVLDRVLHHASAADLVVAGVGDDGVVALSGQGEIMTSRFLKRVGTTVLLVPNQPVEFQGICLGYDGSDGAKCALRSTRGLARLVQCPVHVVYAQDGRHPSDFDPTPGAVEVLKEAGIEVTSCCQIGEAPEVLQAECQGAGFDLLAVGYRGRAGLNGRFLGRVTETLAEELALGLLVSR
jgi:nucleotide-binding universal stress UspA family protein